MIVSLIGSVLGMAGGLLPDIFKEFRESRVHTRELERMDKDAENQLKMMEKKTDAKLAEVEANVAVEEMRAFAKQMDNIHKAQAPTGIPIVDAFNALLRPATASPIMLLFVGTAVLYAWAVITKFMAGSIPLDMAATMIWGSLVGNSIQAVLSFLFGYRSTKGRVSAAR